MKKKNKKSIVKSLNYILPAIFLISLSLGSIFSINLVKYGFFIMLAMVLVVIYYLNESLTNYYKNKNMSKFTLYIGFVALILVSGFFGMQSPQLPFKIYILIIGIVLIFIGIIKVKN
ncbi:MAG: hypothetical protein IIA87_04275 [Nanoarchaeota archaeon]|nr:hypothetical protein [Nanoarchaeota archaeon]